MGSYKPISRADQVAGDYVYRLRQDAIAAGDFDAYRIARELRERLEHDPRLTDGPVALHMLEELWARYPAAMRRESFRRQNRLA